MIGNHRVLIQQTDMIGPQIGDIERLFMGQEGITRLLAPADAPFLAESVGDPQQVIPVSLGDMTSRHLNGLHTIRHHGLAADFISFF